MRLSLASPLYPPSHFSHLVFWELRKWQNKTEFLKIGVLHNISPWQDLWSNILLGSIQSAHQPIKQPVLVIKKVRFNAPQHWTKIFYAFICLHSKLRNNKKLKTYTMLQHALRVDWLICGVIDGLPHYYYGSWIVDHNYQTLI